MSDARRMHLMPDPPAAPAPATDELEVVSRPLSQPNLEGVNET